MNSSPILSMAGIWAFKSDASPSFSGLVDLYSTIHLGVNQAQGVVLGGWALSTDNLLIPRQVNLAVLDQNPDGTLKLNTAKYISNPITYGIGSVIVSDFNGDGVDDIFLGAYNEVPMVPKPTITYLSSGIDSFHKLELTDITLSHSAILTQLNGQKTVVTAGYGPHDYYYQYDATIKSMIAHLWGNTYQNNSKLDGSSATLGDFNSDGQSEIVVADFGGGPSIIKIQSLNGDQLVGDLANLGAGYFTNNSAYPGRDTHMYRVWAEDFNHDGRTDVIVGESTSQDPNAPTINRSKLALLQNQGNYVFSDKTDALGSAYLTTTNNVDYSTQRVDLDNSGINSYLLGDSPLSAVTTQSNYLLVNDGTGKLYAALHDEFVALGSSVQTYLNTQKIKFGPSLSPKFIAYQLADGAVNYLVELVTGDGSNIPLVNLPLHYNITTDFTQNITINDRNESMLMRTWAGNDKFYDTNANASAAHLDGGLGSNTSVYSDKVGNYAITSLGGNGFEVKHAVTNSAPNVDDTIANFSRLVFSDTNIALDIAPTQNAGSVYMLYKAAFNRAAEPGGMGYWLARKDAGDDIVSKLAQGFVDSDEFKGRFGDNPSNASYVDKLYQNVLGRAGEPGGVTYWNQQLDDGLKSKALVLVQFATLAEGAANVAPLIANGIPYTEFLG